MAELPADQEQIIIEALLALGWRKDPDGESEAVIMRLLNCSEGDAKAFLEDLYLNRGLIKQLSSSGGELDERGPIPVSHWRWIATS